MVKLTVEQALLRASSHAKRGEVAEAQKLYELVLKSFPNNKRAQQGLSALKKQTTKATDQAPPQDAVNELINLYNQRQLSVVIERASALMEEYPQAFIVWNILGAAHKALGKVREAAEAFEKATELNPTYAEGFNNMGVALKEQGKLDEAIKSYQKALSLKPDYADAYNNIGNALKEQGKLDGAIASFQRVLSLKPDYADAYNNMGIALTLQGKLDEAIASYQKTVLLKPDYADAYKNMGTALQEQGKLNEAIASYEKALSLKPDYAEAYNNMGIALKKQGNLDAAIALYQKALSLNYTYTDAYNNMGNALKAQGKLKEAIASYQKALSLKPDYADAYSNMGNALHEQGDLDDAIASFQRALSLKPDYADVYHNMGTALQVQGKLNEAIASYEKALSLKPDCTKAEAQMLHQKQNICDFDIFSGLADASSRLGIVTDAVPPFAALSWVDNAREQYLRSQIWASERYTQIALPLPVSTAVRPERIKVGYFSADFHDHATMYLMAGLLREHNKDEFELFSYSYGRSKSGILRQRAEEDADHFFDVTDYPDEQIVDLVRSHSLDVSIDLKGYTQHSRSGIFQYRLAPIQMNYLGYPGSMGADFIDYIIADPIVIPDDQREFYSEQVIYLPHSYQPNDDTREIADIQTSRADFGLPEEAFVFCCFNNNYKISPREYDIWMRLLNQVDGSVLWLLKSNKWAEENLRKEAQLRGLDPERLVFAEKVSHAEHLARHRHADLFIDTFNYNAHTTASDALWGGLPVVTKQGKQFAARVAASLLNAVGLPELITETEEDYERLILELATQPKRLSAIKAKLAEKRLSKPLFDTKRYTRNFEQGLKAAYDLYFEGHKPADIWVREDEV